MRTRIDDQTHPLPTSYPYTIVSLSGAVSSATGTLNYVVKDGQYRRMDDVVTPRFHKRVQEGDVIVSPMTSVTTERDTLLGSYSYYIPKGSGDASNYSQTWAKWPGMVNNLGGPLTHISSRADLVSLSKLAGTQAAANIDASLFEGAIFLAELRETIGFLRNPLSNWNAFLRRLRKTKNRSRFHRQKTVSEYLLSEWLSYRYGVRPLLGDIQDAIKAVEATVKKDIPMRRTARGFASDGESLRDTNYPVNTGSSVTFKWTTKTDRQIKVRAGVLYEYHRSPDTFGVAYHDIPPAIWEALWGSFIIDWFANIGSWIEAVTPIAGVKTLGSWTTTEISTRSTRDSYVFYGGIDSGTGRTRVITSPGTTSEVLDSTDKARLNGISVGLALKVSPLAGWRGAARVLDLVGISIGLLKSR